MSANAAPTTTSVDRRTLTTLTVCKTLANTAQRWIPLFLPTLERAFGASTTALTTLYGVGELAGASTALVGRRLDRGGEDRLMAAALLAVAGSAAVCLIGTVWSFGIGMLLLVAGVANFTVGAHVYISRRVSFTLRGRTIGLLELSWALSLLVGGPVVAAAIGVASWRAPFVLLAVGLVAASVVLRRQLARAARADAAIDASVDGSKPADESSAGRSRLPRSAWLASSGSALLAGSSMGIFVISGTWFDEAFAVSTSGLGVIAVGFGAAELVSSGGSAWIADRIGKVTATLLGSAVQAVGLVVMTVGADSRVAGIAGVIIVLFGFEFAYVTSFSVVSESAPGGQGRVLAISNALGTCTRATAAIASGVLFGAFGINGVIIFSGAVLALAATSLLTAAITSGHLNERRSVGQLN